MTQPPRSSETHDPCTDPASRQSTKRGRPSVEEAQRLPERILEAGWETLLEHGFESFTFDRIARHAHIGKATIYARYASKREFLEALLKFKSDQRRVSILSKGVGLPLIEAYCLRAIEVIRFLLSREGVLFERLFDWLDQEGGDGTVSSRAANYRDAIASIEESLHEAANSGEVTISDVPQAARFWLEGLMGHARLAGSAGNATMDDNETWARRYSEFFFAGIAQR